MLRLVTITGLLAFPIPASTVPYRGAASASAAGASTVVWIANTMDKLFADSLPPPSAAAPTTAKLEAARSEHQPFQLGVRPATGHPLDNVSVSVSLTSQPPAARARGGGGGGVVFEVRRVVRVRVSAASNAQNHTGNFPDPLPRPCPPGGGGEHIPAGSTSAFWITAVVAADAAPGLWHAHVELCAGAAVMARLGLELTVWSFSVANRTQVTDSGFNGLDPASWKAGQRKQFPGLTDAEVVNAWDRGLTSHRVNWMTYTELLPRVGVTIRESLGGSGSNTSQQVTVQLDSAAFEQKVVDLRAQGIQQLAFPMPVRRSLDLAGEKHDGSGTIDHRPFHGVTREW
eukprot:COSAG01_NODE_1102_length_11682_cov_11.201848_10_plen_342_part_01